jgi:hypothetical protein
MTYRRRALGKAKASAVAAFLGDFTRCRRDNRGLLQMRNETFAAERCSGALFDAAVSK